MGLLAVSRSIRFAVACAVALACLGAHASAAPSLAERYQTLRDKLADNAFGRPIHLDSTESSGALRGDAHAAVEHPFALLRAHLGEPEVWCEVLILVFNIKQCEAGARTLVVHIGRKHDQPVAHAHRVEFAFNVANASGSNLRVELNADSGPLGTRDYHIELEAIPIDARRSFLHLEYSYTSGVTARLAMKGYLATVARDKVGFSVVGRRADGAPIHVGGMRGLIERNTMRYYLAIDAYLDSLSAAPAQQLEKRLAGWFDATERYPLQLREMERDDYLAMKRKEAGKRD